MPLMGIETDESFTVLGPCPGCYMDTWEYERRIINEHWWSLQDFYEDVEFILWRHADNCPGLREIIERLGIQ